MTKGNEQLMTNDNNLWLDKVVGTEAEFTGFVELNKAFDIEYRRACRKAFLPTATEHDVFQQVVRAAKGHLNQGRRNLLLASPFGTGKTLDLVMIYDIFSSKGNHGAVQGFESWLKNDLLGLTSAGPYLVVPIVGTENPQPLSQAILNSFQRAIKHNSILTNNADPNHPFLVPVAYQQAAQWLRDVHRGPIGHLAAPLDAFLQNHNSHHTRTSLEKALEDSDLDALEIWRAAYQTVVGTPPPDFGNATPKEVFDSALKVLKNRGFIGIVLLMDELSQYLRLNPQHEAEAIRTLDPLIHWIQGTGSCFSVIATQVVPEYPQGEHEADYQAWSSLLGRFDVYHMKRRQYERIIARVLKRQPNAPVNPDVHSQMQELYDSYHYCFSGSGEDRATIQRMVQSCYPLHPTVLAAISSIADTLGQYERSVFQYLDRKTHDGFNDFIHTHPVYLGENNERLELVTLDEIFRYFAKNNWSRLAALNDGLVRAFQNAEAIAQGDILAKRVLDLLSLLALLEKRASLPSPTVKGIAEMLNVPVDQHLEDILQRFYQEGHFVYDTVNGYRLELGGGPRPIEVENAIRWHMKQYGEIRGQDIVGYIKDYEELATGKIASPFPIQASYEVQVKNVKRKFQSKFVTGQELIGKADKLVPNETLEGNIFVATITVADTFGNKLFREAIRAAEKLAGAGAIVALVRQPTSNLDKPIQYFRAAVTVADDSRLGTSETAKAKYEDARSQLLTALNKEYELDRLDWYTPLKPNSAVRLKDVIIGITDAAEKLSERFPGSIARPDIVGERLKSPDDVLQVLLKGGGKLSDLRSKSIQVYNDVLVPLGVASISTRTQGELGQTLNLIVPDRTKPEFAESLEIWDTLGKALPLGKEVTGATVYDALRSLLYPPYWCPENLVVFMLAAYMGRYKVQVREAHEERFRLPRPEEIKMLVKPRAHLDVRIPQPIVLAPDQWKLLSSIASATTSILPAGATTYHSGLLDPNEPEKALIAVRDDLMLWYREFGAFVSEFTTKYGLTSDQGQAFLTAIKEISEPKNQSSPDFYICILPGALHETALRTPLLVESFIEQVSELKETSEEIKPAAHLKDRNETICKAWNEFARDFLNRDLLSNLLKTVRDFQALSNTAREPSYSPTLNNTPVPPYPNRVIERQQKDDVEPTTSSSPNELERSVHDANTGPKELPIAHPLEQHRASNNGTDSAHLGITPEDLQSFAEYVLNAALQVQSGERKIASFEELLQSYLNLLRSDPPNHREEG
jgi:hypothetical protein